MRLRPYASRPVRLSLQLVADVFVLTWTALWIWVAVKVHHAVQSIAEMSFRMRDGAGGVASHLTDAGSSVNRVPLVGDRLSSPLTSAGGAARNLAGAGQQLGDQIDSAALPIAIAVVAVAVVPLVLPWLALRWRYARRAGATTGLATSPAGTRLLALRAMANQSPARLTRIDPDPVAAWNRDDPEVTAALAALELRRLGLRARALRPSLVTSADG